MKGVSQSRNSEDAATIRERKFRAWLYRARRAGPFTAAKENFPMPKGISAAIRSSFTGESNSAHHAALLLSACINPH
jgi:hypothetical protein